MAISENRKPDFSAQALGDFQPIAYLPSLGESRQILHRQWKAEYAESDLTRLHRRPIAVAGLGLESHYRQFRSSLTNNFHSIEVTIFPNTAK